MSEDIGIPLPEDFYDVPGWFDSLITFYSEDQKKFEREVLEGPFNLLTTSVGDAIAVYGYSSNIILKALEQLLNPLFVNGEYKERVYRTLKEGAKAENDPRIDNYAESLLRIRNICERDREFLNKHFSSELAQIPGDDPAANFIKFSETLRLITKVHIQQVINMVKDHQRAESL